MTKLNLGCGKKILPGYVNVDITPRQGAKPDVECDVRNLHVFSDNYADEILSVHVIEHFYRWEVEAVLAEWVRVLKPGGTMILETPNLVTACRKLLEDPVNLADPDSRETMWPLYGDPGHKDPLMCHRWLFTPYSLARCMVKAGLSNIRQEPAQFKMREPRDMRIVGTK